MKVSIITIAFNAADTIEETIQSVLNQDYNSIEYIIIDGGSKDKTLHIIDKYRHHITTLISELDKGVYDAMNKGIASANGDIIAILNADDTYASAQVITNIVKAFEQSNADTCYGDLVYVDRGIQAKSYVVGFQVLTKKKRFNTDGCHHTRRFL